MPQAVSNGLRFGNYAAGPPADDCRNTGYSNHRGQTTADLDRRHGSLHGGRGAGRNLRCSIALSIRFPRELLDHEVSFSSNPPSGAIFITSASDPGNDGPFASAVYFAGTFNINNSQKITFAPSRAMTRLFTFDYHKVEGFEFVPGADGGIAFGTDDENLGAAIYLNWE